MEGSGDGQLVVAVVVVGHEGAGQVEHSIGVPAVISPATLVTCGVIVMGVENFLDERMGVQQLDGR